MKFRVILDPVVELDKNLTYLEVRTLFKRGVNLGRFISVNIDKSHLCIGLYSKELVFIGRKFFIRTIKVNEFCKASTGRFYGDPRFIFIQHKLLNALGIEWAKDLNEKLIKPSIAYDILTKKYTNLEDLLKAYIKRYYNGAFAYKDVLQYYRHSYGISLYEIKEFTTNPALFLHRLVECTPYTSDPQLMVDTLRSAIDLDETINSKWSINRFNIEHTRQNRLAIERELSSKNSTPIFSNEVLRLFEYPNLKVLNNEQDVFKEAKYMVNCLYSLHWNKISNRKVVTFHMTKPEEATIEFAINTIDNKTELTCNEARGRYNATLSRNTTELINYILKGFNMRNLSILKDYIDNTPVNIAAKPLPPLYDDNMLPF